MRQWGWSSIGAITRTAWRWGTAIVPPVVIAYGVFVLFSIVARWPLTPTLVGAQAMLPVVLVGLLGASMTALVVRRWRTATVGAVAAVAAAMLVVPTMTARPVPAWASRSDVRHLSVFSANVRFSNASIDAALDRARRSNADVIVLNEFVPAFDAALERSGLLAEYPTVVRDRVRDANVLLTRLPVTSSGLIHDAGIELPSATVRVGDTEVLVASVHTQAPHARGYFRRWRRQVDGVARAVAGHDDVIAVGDFNSSLWNPPFRRLLDWGFVDASDATGNGTARTWGHASDGATVEVPLIGIDHAISRGPRITPVWMGTDVVPGSDHRSLSVTYAVA